MQSPSYYAPYNNYPIYEFDPIFDLNTDDLNTTTTGYSVHRSKDVKFIFNVNDRQSNVLTSTSSIFENPFIKSINIDILDISGNIISGDYISNSSESNFSFTEQENINVFGEYTANFGLGVQVISSNTNIHTNEYYVYANKLEIEKISIIDKNGRWLNDAPSANQVYSPSLSYEIDCFFENITDSALYWKEYQVINSGYHVDLSGLISFAILTGECLKIDWGYTSGLETIFHQTGLSGYQGIDNLFVTNTDIGDFRLINAIDPTGINGETYNFITGYDYPTGITGIYNANIYYSGINSTGNELIKTIRYRIPDELKSQGKHQIGDSSTGKINFEIQLLNNPFYTDFDKFEIYLNTGSGANISNSNLIQTIPIFTTTSYYSFSLDSSFLSANKDHWFVISPYGKIGKGYDWVVGPYSFFAEEPQKTSINTESINLLNGDYTANIDFVVGSILDNQATTIDYISKGTHKTYDYLCRFEDESGSCCSSRLLIIDNTSGTDITKTGVSFSQYGISDNSFINLSVQDSTTGIYLKAQLDTPTGYYKLYKTSI